MRYCSMATFPDLRQHRRRGLHASTSTWSRLTICAVFGLVLAANQPPASAQVQSPAARKAEQRKLRQDKRQQELQLKQTNQNKAELQKQLALLQAERERLNGDLVRTAAQMQRTEARLSSIEERLKFLGERERGLRTRLGKKHKIISWLLGRMMLMGRNPPPAIITHPKDIIKMIRRAKLLGYHEPRIRGEIQALTSDLDSLGKVVDETRLAQAKHRREAVRRDQDRTRLASLIETKRQTFLSKQSELEEVRKTAEIITNNVAGLNELIAKLDKAVENSTNLGRYNRKTAKLARRGPQAAPADKPRPGKSAKPRPSTVELAPNGSERVANPGRLEPALPFRLAKARLPLPAYGKKVIDFGDKTAQGGRSKGIVIKTRHGASITSPCDGWVVYAGSFRSYGQLLIINAGGGYHVLLANLSRLDVQLGQFILAAEPVGSMAGVSQVKGQASDPVLYVEFRKNGKPIDPGPWWASGRQRVQG